VLTAWEAALAAAGQDKVTLRRRWDALEALYASRLSIREGVASEKIIQKIELMRLWRAKADPTSFMQDPPCWRELYSWRILIAKSLNHIEDFARQTDMLLGYPEPCERPEWESLYWQDVHFNRDLSHRWKEEILSESTARTRWSVARTASAVALFRLEKGRDPAGVDELVPLYLRDVPRTFPSGDRIEFEDGAVGARKSADPGSELWHLFGR
jgi:hypothetical protein